MTKLLSKRVAVYIIRKPHN